MFGMEMQVQGTALRRRVSRLGDVLGTRYQGSAALGAHPAGSMTVTALGPLDRVWTGPWLGSSSFPLFPLRPHLASSLCPPSALALILWCLTIPLSLPCHHQEL